MKKELSMQDIIDEVNKRAEALNSAAVAGKAVAANLCEDLEISPGDDGCYSYIKYNHDLVRGMALALQVIAEYAEHHSSKLWELPERLDMQKRQAT